MNRALVALAVVASMLSGCATLSPRQGLNDVRDNGRTVETSRRDDAGAIHRDEQFARMSSSSSSQSPSRRAATGASASRR